MMHDANENVYQKQQQRQQGQQQQQLKQQQHHHHQYTPLTIVQRHDDAPMTFHPAEEFEFLTSAENSYFRADGEYPGMVFDSSSDNEGHHKQRPGFDWITDDSNCSSTTTTNNKGKESRDFMRPLESDPEEAERRRIRRERNKLAAAKCRQRRVDLTNHLLAESETLTEEKLSLESEISMLHKQRNELKQVLDEHALRCHANASSTNRCHANTSSTTRCHVNASSKYHRLHDTSVMSRRFGDYYSNFAGVRESLGMTSPVGMTSSFANDPDVFLPCHHSNLGDPQIPHFDLNQMDLVPVMEIPSIPDPVLEQYPDYSNVTSYDFASDAGIPCGVTCEVGLTYCDDGEPLSPTTLLML